MKILKELKKEREIFYKGIKQIGNFQRGTLSVTYSKKEHPGHGPHYIWSTTVKGKSYVKRLKLGPELQKYKNIQDVWMCLSLRKK